MDDNIQNYRQPMMTSIGIILGFVLGFTGKWATEPVVLTMQWRMLSFKPSTPVGRW